MNNSAHFPVMLNEVLDALCVKGGVYVDGTLGSGGYTQGILEAHDDAHVIAIDRDSEAFTEARKRLGNMADRVTFVQGEFGDLAGHLDKENVSAVDGIVVDLGVSSMQLDRPERGFSFRFDGPLDMRMDQNSGGETAADVVNTKKESDLADVIYLYGGERKSRRVASAICRARKEEPFETTSQLADVVRSVVPKSKADSIDPATRTFQALRIYVNREMEQLESLLENSAPYLKEGGRLVVVSFHSLEDGLVKRFFLEYSGQKARQSRHFPDVVSSGTPLLYDVPSKKSIKPTSEEVSSNPRSRSARLRYGIRTSVAGDEIKP